MLKPPPPSSITSRAFITEAAFTPLSAIKVLSTTNPTSTNQPYLTLNACLFYRGKPNLINLVHNLICVGQLR